MIPDLMHPCGGRLSNCQMLGSGNLELGGVLEFSVNEVIFRRIDTLPRRLSIKAIIVATRRT
jgi:hypothetical protein